MGKVLLAWIVGLFVGLGSSWFYFEGTEFHPLKKLIGVLAFVVSVVAVIITIIIKWDEK
jgi:hypothetical protein